MSFKYAYKPGFNPKEVQARKAAQFAQNYYATANARQQRRINFRRTIAGQAPLAPRGFGSMSFAPNRERKYADKDQFTQDVNTGGAFNLLCIPELGSDFDDRIGRKILIKSVYIRGRVMLEAATQSAPVASLAQQARCIIFVDNQPNGAAPAVTDLLKQSFPTSQLNANNRDRFRIIKDKTYTFDPLLISTTAGQSIATNGRTIYDIKMYKKVNIETIFNGTNGGTIGDINTGALYMFWIGSAAAGATDCNTTLTSRVRFDDA